ncbi:glycosyltransferase family 39 protein [bacterium]|nr:glycosyltransferase family 39 protein [bacterium]
MPHRDFDAVYSGGLEWAFSLLVAIFGRDLIVFRIALFGIFLVTIWFTHRIALRFLDKWGAFLSTAIFISLGIGQTAVPLPTWFNVSLAIVAIWTVLRFAETDHRRWLVLGGVLAGISISIKIIGLYHLAAALFAVALLRADRRRDVLLTGSVAPLAAVFGAVFLGLVWAVSAPQAGASAFLNFLLPLGALVAAVVGAARRTAAKQVLPELTLDVRAIFLGTGLGLIPLLLPYLVTGSLPELLQGVLVSPQSRYEYASIALPPAPDLILGMVLAASLLAGMTLRMRSSLFATGAFLGALGVVALFIGTGRLSDLALLTLRGLIPILIIWGSVLVARSAPDFCKDEHRALTVLLPFVAILSLLQIPFASDWYVFFIGGLAILGTACLQAVRGVRTVAPLTLATTVVLLGWSFEHATSVSSDQRVSMPFEGVSVKGAADNLIRYRRVLSLVDSVSDGDAIFATPYLPEIYYLTGRTNPTRTIVDILDADYSDGDLRVARILRQLKSAAVDVVVTGPPLWPQDESLQVALSATFPLSVKVDLLTVRWR